MLDPRDDSQRPIHVLAVDDDPGVLVVVEAACGLAGMKCSTTSHPAEVLDLVLALEPDVILLDVMMPDMDGGEVKSRLRQIPGCKESLIIFLTALFQEGDHNSRDLFIPKPVDVDRITRFIDSHRRAA